QQRAAGAAADGRLAAEITPVPGDAKRDELVRADEQRRPATTLEKLAALRPIVSPEGTVTAGNASGLNDGACALLLASEEAVKRHGLRPLARILGAASAGVAPRTMGLGPVPAIGKLLARLQLQLADFERIEI